MSVTLHGITLSALAQAVGGMVNGTDCEIRSVSTDSRSLVSGDVYFCLRGENFDGHAYAQAAASAGCA